MGLNEGIFTTQTITCKEDRTRAFLVKDWETILNVWSCGIFQGRNDKDGSEKLSQRPQKTEETAL